MLAACEDSAVQSPPNIEEDASVDKIPDKNSNYRAAARVGIANQYPLGIYATLSRDIDPEAIKSTGARVVILFNDNSDSNNADEVKAYLDKVREVTQLPRFVVELPRQLAQEYMENKLSAERAELLDYVIQMSQHPKVEGFMLVDEPEFRRKNNSFYNAFNVRSLHNIVKEVSSKTTFVTFAAPHACDLSGDTGDCSKVAEYESSMDVALFDYYPYDADGSAEFENANPEDGTETYIKAVRAAQDIITIINRDRAEPLEWGVIFQASGSQNFGKRLPTLDELRFMFYAPLADRNYSLPNYMIGYSLSVALSSSQNPNALGSCTNGADWFFSQSGPYQAWTNISVEYNRWKKVVEPGRQQRWKVLTKLEGQYVPTNQVRANCFRSPATGEVYLIVVNLTNTPQSLRFRKQGYNQQLSTAVPLWGNTFQHRLPVNANGTKREDRWNVTFSDQLLAYGTRVYRLQ